MRMRTNILLVATLYLGRRDTLVGDGAPSEEVLPSEGSL